MIEVNLLSPVCHFECIIHFIIHYERSDLPVYKHIFSALVLLTFLGSYHFNFSVDLCYTSYGLLYSFIV